MSDWIQNALWYLAITLIALGLTLLGGLPAFFYGPWVGLAVIVVAGTLIYILVDIDFMSGPVIMAGWIALLAGYATGLLLRWLL